MNVIASDAFPFRLHWDSQDLADAVPLRLFELVDFAAGDTAATCANAASLRRNALRDRYLPSAALSPRFRIHG